VDKAVRAFREAIATTKQIELDFFEYSYHRCTFSRTALMLKKTLKNRGAAPVFIGLSPGLKKLFRLNGLDFK